MRVLILVSLVALSACNKDAQTGNRAAVATAGTDVRLQPGNWSTTTEIVSIDMPGAPAAVKNQMLAAAKQAGAKMVDLCLTPEQATRPPSEMFAGAKQAGCTTDRFSTAGGRMDVALTCAPPQAPGTKVAMTMTGPMTPTGYELSMDQKITSAQMPGGGMTMKARVVGKRVGECKA